MSRFKQLTREDRCKIEAWRRVDRKVSNIASWLGVDRSTIYRELNKQNTPAGYRALSAQVRREKARLKSRPKRKIEEGEIFSEVVDRLRQGWSPEEISGRFAKEITEGARSPADLVCHETIYRFVYQSDFGKRVNLYEYLRRGQKHRRHQCGRASQHSTVPNRVFIDKRPEAVASRQDVGHWEGDTIVYPNKQGIYNLVERKTRFTMLTKLMRRSASAVQEVVTKRLASHYRATITFDSGTEHAYHQAIGQLLKVLIYFCHPYHSWEKGSVENCNGLVRRYLPRGHSIIDLTQEDLDDIAWELNNRPRKILGFATPQEMLSYEYQKLTDVAVGMRM